MRLKSLIPLHQSLSHYPDVTSHAGITQNLYQICAISVPISTNKTQKWHAHTPAHRHSTKSTDPAETGQLHLETVIGIEDTGRDDTTTKTDGGHERTEIEEIGAEIGAREKDTETETEIGVDGKKGVVEIRIGVREKTVDLLEAHARRATTATKTNPRKTPEQLWPAEPQDQAPPAPVRVQTQTLPKVNPSRRR